MATPEICPNCGADVPRNAKACPGCGSDEQTGWSENAASSNLDLPDDNFNYDEFVSREFGSKKHLPAGIAWHWWLVAVVLLLAFIGLWVWRS